MDVRTVAWVPEAEGRSWSVAAELAVLWLRRQASEHGEKAGVVLPKMQDYGIPAFRQLAWKTTRRSGRNRVPAGRLAVLAYVPDWESLQFATQLARGGSLVVVEGFGTKLEGWARWHEALDLTTGLQSEALPDDLVELVNRLRFYGNNGFGSPGDLALAKGLVDAAQPIDTELLPAAMLAAGQSVYGVERLVKNIE